MFALHSPNSLLETELHMSPSREKAWTADPLLSGSAFSPVRYVNEILPNTGMFRIFPGKGRGYFSAVQTAWRSGKDSNPWYRSETCKSRRVRKLHGIKSFKNSLRLPASRGVVANRWGFQRSSKANPWGFSG